MRVLTLVWTAAVVWLASPEVAVACERCFGAGSDSPAVRAVTASMLGLFIIMSFVFGGVFSFFNAANNRADEIESAREREAAGQNDSSPLTPTDHD